MPLTAMSSPTPRSPGSADPPAPSPLHPAVPGCGLRSEDPHRWSQRVTARSDALDLEPGVFLLEDPRAIAASLLRSAEQSTRRKAPPFRSAMSMLCFYINRAGSNLSEERREVLEAAKVELRRLCGREG